MEKNRIVYIHRAARTPSYKSFDGDLVTLMASCAREIAAEFRKEIDCLYVGSQDSSGFCEVSHLAAHVADALNLPGVEALHVESASNALGVVVAACRAVQQGATVLVVSGEMMNGRGLSTTARTRLISRVLPEGDRQYGLTMPSAVAIIADCFTRKRHMPRSEMRDLLMRVSMVEYDLASRNPNAQFQGSNYHRDAIEKRYNSENNPSICEPLTLLDMCPTTDGAGALLLSPEKVIRGRASKAHVSGFAVASDFNHIYQRTELDGLHATTVAARKAYGMAGIPLDDLDGTAVIPDKSVEGLFLQSHDAFGPLYLMNLIQMGLCREAHLKEALLQGHFDPLHVNCRIPTNVCGGFKDGHPLGATGLIKLIEAYRQLTGEAECLRLSQIVKDFTPRTAIQNSIGGPGSCNAVVVLDHIDNPPRRSVTYPGGAEMMARRSKALPSNGPPWKGCFIAGTRRYLRDSAGHAECTEILDMAVVHLDCDPENMSTRILVTPDNLPELEYGDAVEIYRGAEGRLRCR